MWRDTYPCANSQDGAIGKTMAANKVRLYKVINVKSIKELHLIFSFCIIKMPMSHNGNISIYGFLRRDEHMGCSCCGAKNLTFFFVLSFQPFQRSVWWLVADHIAVSNSRCRREICAILIISCGRSGAPISNVDRIDKILQRFMDNFFGIGIKPEEERSHINEQKIYDL